MQPKPLVAQQKEMKQVLRILVNIALEECTMTRRRLGSMGKPLLPDATRNKAQITDRLTALKNVNMEWEEERERD